MTVWKMNLRRVEYKERCLNWWMEFGEAVRDHGWWWIFSSLEATPPGCSLGKNFLWSLVDSIRHKEPWAVAAGDHMSCRLGPKRVEKHKVLLCMLMDIGTLCMRHYINFCKNGFFFDSKGILLELKKEKRPFMWLSTTSLWSLEGNLAPQKKHT